MAGLNCFFFVAYTADIRYLGTEPWYLLREMRSYSQQSSDIKSTGVLVLGTHWSLEYMVLILYIHI